jgi:hypothetical protein
MATKMKQEQLEAKFSGKILEMVQMLDPKTSRGPSTYINLDLQYNVSKLFVVQRSDNYGWIQ